MSAGVILRRTPGASPRQSPYAAAPVRTGGDWLKAAGVMMPTKAAAIMPFGFGNIPIQRTSKGGGSHGGLPVHLCDERLEQDLSRRPRGAEGYLAVLPTRCQDRGSGRKRRG